MKVIRNERVIPIDVDDTLVMHSFNEALVDKLEIIQIYDPIENGFITVRKNLPMIRLLKEEHSRGAHILVWSRGGFEWADSVVTALRITEFVDQIMSKPMVYLDDKPVEQWLKDRVYLDADMKYKTNLQRSKNGI